MFEQPEQIKMYIISSKTFSFNETCLTKENFDNKNKYFYLLIYNLLKTDTKIYVFLPKNRLA